MFRFLSFASLKKSKIRLSATFNSTAKKKKLVECLLELKNAEFTNSTACEATSLIQVEKVLNLIFQAGLKRMHFTEEEKRQIGNLLVDTIEPIQFNIVRTLFRCRSRLELAVLMKRSVLQFLVEDYAEFPARSSTLLKELEQVNIKESIMILDHIIMRFRDLYDSDEGESDRELVGVSEVPHTHTWWFY